VKIGEIIFEELQPMSLITIHQRHRQTDGRTDDMRSQDRALHCSASRVKKTTTQKLVSSNCSPSPVQYSSSVKGSPPEGSIPSVGFYYRGRSPTHWTFFETWNSFWFLSVRLA